MGSLAGNFQRPVIAASAVAIASISADFCDKLNPSTSSEPSPSSTSHALENLISSSWVSRISLSRLTQLRFVNRIQVPMPRVNMSLPNHNLDYHSFFTSPVLFNFYQSAGLEKLTNPAVYTHSIPTLPPSEVLYRWHLPEPDSIIASGGSSESVSKSRTVVVLLGWLGAKQKHLKRYADWYTSRGFHAITFTFPMSDVLSYQVGGKAEQNVELLVNHLAEWIEEEPGKNLVFHTFSNTGWLTYGVLLEKIQNKDSDLVARIKGCIVDSAPVAAPDPQVWASGFSAAFLKKNSVAAKGYLSKPSTENTVRIRTSIEVKPGLTEGALLLVLEKFFGVVLNYPSVNRRLSDVLSLLSSNQPSCPQLYIYSSADKVIPADSVESFIEKQRQSGHEVRSCNFISTPHVDHFRNDPKKYSSQLIQFLDDSVLQTIFMTPIPTYSTFFKFPFLTSTLTAPICHLVYFYFIF